MSVPLLWQSPAFRLEADVLDGPSRVVVHATGLFSTSSLGSLRTARQRLVELDLPVTLECDDATVTCADAREVLRSLAA